MTFDRLYVSMFSVMDMFYMTTSNIPEGVGFGAYGLVHFIWLGILVISCSAAVIIYRRLNTEKRNIMRITVAAMIVLNEIIKNIMLIITHQFEYGHLPFHLCGINIMVIAFHAFKRTKTVDNFLYLFSIVGAMLALLFPNWAILPAWNFMCLHSFTIHILLVLYPVMLLSSGDIKPDIRFVPKCMLMLIAFAVPAYILNRLWDTNFMFLMEPDKGNPLELFKNLLGSHLWAFPILLPVVVLVMYLPPIIYNKIKSRKECEKEKVKA